uniref:Uncharacterized protein n=1 Tax=Rhizophora mucronata TaxID=61149 RepID=A0A2P2Q4E0_RHIMU
MEKIIRRHQHRLFTRNKLKCKSQDNKLSLAD